MHNHTSNLTGRPSNNDAFHFAEGRVVGAPKGLGGTRLGASGGEPMDGPSSTEGRVEGVCIRLNPEGAVVGRPAGACGPSTGAEVGREGLGAGGITGAAGAAPMITGLSKVRVNNSI